jgi:hypothetical protein
MAWMSVATIAFVIFFKWHKLRVLSSGVHDSSMDVQLNTLNSSVAV